MNDDNNTVQPQDPIGSGDPVSSTLAWQKLDNSIPAAQPAQQPARSTVSQKAQTLLNQQRGALNGGKLYSATSTPAARPVASAPANTVKAKTIATRPVSTGAVTVKRGQTLSQIAQAHHTTVAAVAKMNGISNPNSIMVGQKLNFSGAASLRQPSPVKRVAVPTFKKKR